MVFTQKWHKAIRHPKLHVRDSLDSRLHKLISQMSEENKPVNISNLTAKVIPWESGLDILKAVKTFPLV
ncbi:hypothetical protein RRG08_035312 [Elysia crispata]|uniref:Uncharacterized protein n=1 Tax=Elysia crispata TaxID=231223 RepID=A0AAE0YTK4_9GAST|nr:hypothetical protein RRG08_035312 [Elysia crispata]